MRINKIFNELYFYLNCKTPQIQFLCVHPFAYKLPQILYQLSTKLYDKGDDFNFAIINCPHLYSNIPNAPAYDGVYISQFIRFSRACSLYSECLQRHTILSTKLLNQRFLKNRLILSFKMVSDDINILLKSIPSLSLAYR